MSTPPPRPAEPLAQREPPPPPLPETLVTDAIGKLRVPALILLIGSALQAILYATTVAWSIGLLALLLSVPTANNDPVASIVVLGLATAFNVVSFVPLGIVAYGGIRMIRADGYGWAIGGAILQLVWCVTHAVAILYTAVGLGCLLGPIEVVVGLIAGTIAVVALAPPRVSLAFEAVKAHPELLHVSSAQD